MTQTHLRLSTREIAQMRLRALSKAFEAKKGYFCKVEVIADTIIRTLRESMARAVESVHTYSGTRAHTFLFPAISRQTLPLELQLPLMYLRGRSVANYLSDKHLHDEVTVPACAYWIIGAETTVPRNTQPLSLTECMALGIHQEYLRPYQAILRAENSHYMGHGIHPIMSICPDRLKLSCTFALGDNKRTVVTPHCFERVW